MYETVAKCFRVHVSVDGSNSSVTFPGVSPACDRSSHLCSSPQADCQLSLVVCRDTGSQSSSWHAWPRFGVLDNTWQGRNMKSLPPILPGWKVRSTWVEEQSFAPSACESTTLATGVWSKLPNCTYDYCCTKPTLAPRSVFLLKTRGVGVLPKRRERLLPSTWLVHQNWAPAVAVKYEVRWSGPTHPSTLVRRRDSTQDRCPQSEEKWMGPASPVGGGCRAEVCAPNGGQTTDSRNHILWTDISSSCRCTRKEECADFQFQTGIQVSSVWEWVHPHTSQRI